MDKKKHLRANNAKALSVPIRQEPLVELTGENRLLIENHRGVAEYGMTRICVLVTYGHIQVSGKCLHLQYLAKDRLLIMGNIDSILLCRRC